MLIVDETDFLTDKKDLFRLIGMMSGHSRSVMDYAQLFVRVTV